MVSSLVHIVSSGTSNYIRPTSMSLTTDDKCLRFYDPIYLCRGGAGPRGALPTLSQYMLSSAATFGFFLSIGSVSPPFTLHPHPSCPLIMSPNSREHSHNSNNQTHAKFQLFSPSLSLSLSSLHSLILPFAFFWF